MEDYNNLIDKKRLIDKGIFSEEEIIPKHNKYEETVKKLKGLINGKEYNVDLKKKEESFLAITLNPDNQNSKFYVLERGYIEKLLDKPILAIEAVHCYNIFKVLVELPSGYQLELTGDIEIYNKNWIPGLYSGIAASTVDTLKDNIHFQLYLKEEKKRFCMIPPETKSIIFMMHHPPFVKYLQFRFYYIDAEIVIDNKNEENLKENKK